MTINELFEEARGRIAVPEDVLKEARKRRDAIRRIVEEEFDTLRTFGSGSLAHGTQNDPLNDADAGVVLDRRTYEDLGPDGEGPCAKVEEVRGVLRTRLKEEYPGVRFYTGGHRAIRVNFMESIRPGVDNFTADLIVAIRRDEGGLYIPDLDGDDWDPSDPERHVELIVARNKKTGSRFARILRLAKHANAHNRQGRRHAHRRAPQLPADGGGAGQVRPGGRLRARVPARQMDQGLRRAPVG